MHRKRQWLARAAKTAAQIPQPARQAAGLQVVGSSLLPAHLETRPMTKLTTSQLTLLHALAAAPQPAPTKTAEPKLYAAAARLVALDLASLASAPDDPSLSITQAGRDLLAALEPVPQEPVIEPEPEPAPKTKLDTLVALLRRQEGASLPVMMRDTGWQAHSVRGAMSGALKKARGLNIVSDKQDGNRIYRIAL